MTYRCDHAVRLDASGVVPDKSHSDVCDECRELVAIDRFFAVVGDADELSPVLPNPKLILLKAELLRHSQAFEEERETTRWTGVTMWSVIAIIWIAILGSNIDSLASAAVSDEANKLKWLRAFTQLARGKELAASVGSGYAIVVFPFMFQLDDDYPLRDIHGMVEDVATREQIPYLDLLDAFAGHDYVSLWVHPSDQHPNELGHEIAADAMAEFLIREGLIPRE